MMATGGAPTVSTLLAATTGMIYQGSARHPVREIIVHCSDTLPSWMDGRDIADQVKEIRRWHVEERGWKDIGYHWIIGRYSVEAAATTSVSLDGWSIETATPAAMIGANLPVSRNGFNALGQPVTVIDNVIVKDRVRLPYPNQTTLTANKVALSEFVYAGELLDGIANMSARPAPLPVAAWVSLDRVICKTGVYTAKLAVAHAHARSGKPVAAVKFIASDGTNTVEVLVSNMSSLLCAVSGFTIPHFAADLNLSGLIAGATITIDAIIYPWVGAAFQLSVNGDPYPSSNLTTLRILNDRLNTFGTAYAYVDPVNGTASGVASSTPASAAASPFLTYAQAGAAIRAFNNANFGRNYADGGVIRLIEGLNPTVASGRTNMPTLMWPVTIEAADPSKKLTTFLGNTTGDATSNSFPAFTTFKGISPRRGPDNAQTNQGVQAFSNGAGAQNYNFLMSFEDCDFNGADHGQTNSFIYIAGLVMFVNCTETGGGCGQAGRTGLINKATRSIGCKGTGFLHTDTNWGALGCDGIGTVTNHEAYTARVAGQGCLIGWSALRATSDGSRCFSLSATTGPKGVALIGCILEQRHGLTSAAAYFSADGSVTPQQNVLFMCCTVIGARTNWLYQDDGSATVYKSGYMRFVVQEFRNTKTDVFNHPVSGLSGERFGNWSACYNVGHSYNYARRGASDASAPGVGNWLGENLGVGDRYGSGSVPLNPAWLNDQSTYGGAAGNGDYTPGAGSDLTLIPAGMTPYPVDLYGRAVPVNGTARVGALQMAA